MRSAIVQIHATTWLLQGEVGGRPLQLPLLRGGSTYLLLDTGCAHHVDSLILPALRELRVMPESLRWIVNTHPDTDHIGGNKQLKRFAPRAVLACGVADRQQVESNHTLFCQRYDAYRAEHNHFYPLTVKQDILMDLGGDQVIDLGLVEGAFIQLDGVRTLEVIGLPGHSDGHLGLLDRETNTLFGGDAIHGAVYLNSAGRPALCPTYLDVPSYRRTIEKIGRLRPSHYVSCHWPLLDEAGVLAFCDESTRFVDRVESLLLDHLKTSPATLTELCNALGPQLGEWPEPIHHELCYALAGHLRDLEARGLLIGTRSSPRRFSVPEAL